MNLLSTTQNLIVSKSGLKIVGEMDFTQWSATLSAIHDVKSAYHCILADHLRYGRARFGDSEVAIALEQAEFDLADVLKADSIGQLSLDFRQAHTLNSEHYFILSRLPSDEQEKWAKIATDENLSPLELKRSIDAGKVLHQSDISATSGQGSGLNTIQGVVFRLQQWERDMGGSEKIVTLPSEERRNLLKLLTPMIALAAQIEASLTSF